MKSKNCVVLAILPFKELTLIKSLLTAFGWGYVAIDPAENIAVEKLVLPGDEPRPASMSVPKGMATVRSSYFRGPKPPVVVRAKAKVRKGRRKLRS